MTRLPSVTAYGCQSSALENSAPAPERSLDHLRDLLVETDRGFCVGEARHLLTGHERIAVGFLALDERGGSVAIRGDGLVHRVHLLHNRVRSGWVKSSWCRGHRRGRCRRESAWDSSSLTLDLRAAMASASSLNFLQSAVKKSPCILPCRAGSRHPSATRRSPSPLQGVVRVAISSNQAPVSWSPMVQAEVQMIPIFLGMMVDVGMLQRVVRESVSGRAGGCPRVSGVFGTLLPRYFDVTCIVF